MSGKSVVIANIASKSDPDRAYSLTAHSDGVVSCSCPSWRFQKIAPAARTCKHMREFGTLRASAMAAALAA